ncbi:hypothetical protein [Streptomyces sp. CA2R101]|uniref:hypothetical protein n=1 Tax=Streptomyces sp. CA2R101 TaxID=3120152 RepID=UPI00300844DB
MTSPGFASSDMVLPPSMVEDPSPLRVSTFSKPEYGKLTFVYGKVKDDSATWPVHCKRFTVRIPTGRQASALTSEPTLIRAESTVPDGKRQWKVDRYSNPNEVVFTCQPEGGPAEFDGIWSFQLELRGIEINGGMGPVNITWEESTSTTGEDGPFIERSGRGEVSKRDDSFYLHSFRPAAVAINRNTKATLHWEGTPNAIYTMYYRAQDGSQQASTAKDGIWESPVTLLDDTTFTLQAAMGNETRYLTTHVKVNNPDITVNNVTANGDVAIAPEKALKVTNISDAQAGQRMLFLTSGALQVVVPMVALHSVTLQQDQWLAVNEIRANGHPTVNIKDGLTANGNVTITAGKTLTANGPITANDAVTVAAGKTLTANGPIKANDAVTVAVGKPLTANGHLTANAGATVNGTLTTGEATVNGLITFNGAANVISSHVLQNYGKGVAKPTEARPYSHHANTDGFLLVRGRYYNYYSADDRHGPGARMTVGAGGTNYVSDIPAEGNASNQRSTGFFESMTVPVSRGTTARVWVENVAPAGESLTDWLELGIFWFSLGK